MTSVSARGVGVLEGGGALGLPQQHLAGVSRLTGLLAGRCRADRAQRCDVENEALM